MSEVKHELRLYQDGDGLTHWVCWDDNYRTWFRVCDVRRAVPGKPDDDHDSRHGIVTCFRCMNKTWIGNPTVGMGNTEAIAKIDFTE